MKSWESAGMIFAPITRDDHTTCQFCRAPFWNPHGNYKKKPCPRNVIANPPKAETAK